MKKLIAILIAITVCCAMVLPVAAEEFVPSISYKDEPEILDKPVIKDEAQEEIKDLSVVVTPVAGALDTPDADRTEAEKVLIDIYGKLDNGEMELPKPENEDNYYVVRDLVDISVLDAEGNDAENVSSVEVTFDLGLQAGQEVVIMVYDNDKWKIVENVNYGSNGSVTVVFDTLGPVAFCVENESSSSTGDKMASEMGLWIGVMAVSACAIVVLVVTRRRVRN